MSTDNRAVWVAKRKGKPVYISGSWSFNWAKNWFWISLVQSKYTRDFRSHDFWACDDHPEWGEWKLVRDAELKERIYRKLNPTVQNVNL